MKTFRGVTIEEELLDLRAVTTALGGRARATLPSEVLLPEIPIWAERREVARYVLRERSYSRNLFLVRVPGSFERLNEEHRRRRDVVVRMEEAQEFAPPP